MHVIVTVQDKLNTFVFENLLQMRAIAERLAMMGLSRQWRMMDQENAVETLLAEFSQYMGQRIELFAAKRAAGAPQ